MEPPSYEEASLHPHALGTEAFNILPPPSYDTSLHSPPTPPPTYREAVTIQPDPFPVLTPPGFPAAVTSPSQNTGFIFLPPTPIGVAASVGPVVTQPQPVLSSVTCLRDVPGVVDCPHCRRVITTNVTYLPGRAAWCMCVLLTLMGLVCGFCMIPFMIRGLQDVHHYCPQCRRLLHIHTR